MKNNTLYVLVGLPGSGKSTYAKTKSANEHYTVIASSDEMRKFHFGDESIQEKDGLSNEFIFNKVDEYVKSTLEIGGDVIYDATSLTVKNRQRIVDKFRDIAFKIVCVYMNTSLQQCLENNKNRDKKVPEDVILRMADKFEHPAFTKQDAMMFDEILIINSKQDKEK